MRAPTALALSILATAPALGADFPVLRGSFAPATAPRADDDQTQWAGIYAGAHGGYSSGKFGNLTSINDLVANILRNTAAETEFHPSTWPNTGGGTSRSASFGGFLGYNMVFGDAVLGLEADFTKLSMKTTSADSIGRVIQTSTGYVETVDITSSANAKIDSYATLRARIGWAAGSFMPYLTGGVAVSKSSYNAAVTVVHTGDDADPASPPALPSFSLTTTATAGKKNVYALGGTVGAGVDMLVTPNILLRAEYQLVRFGGSSGAPVDINTVRVGAGVKF